MTEKKGITDYKIWYPYEIFYIESMLTIARGAMEAQTQLQQIIEELESGKPNTQDISDYVVDLIINILTSAAALSRYFFPVRSKNIVSKERGERLREVFQISDESPLKNREMRNVIEHFDEKLDKYLLNGVAGSIIPMAIVGNIRNDQKIYHFFRAFDTSDWTFEVLSVRVKISPIISEIIRIYLLLEKFRIDGGRLPEDKTN